MCIKLTAISQNAKSKICHGESIKNIVYLSYVKEFVENMQWLLIFGAENGSQNHHHFSVQKRQDADHFRTKKFQKCHQDA